MHDRQASNMTVEYDRRIRPSNREEMTVDFTMELCSLPVQVHHRYPHIRTLCADYLCSAADPVLTVEATEAEIDAEMAITEGRFARAVCESTCLHRAIVRGFVPHGIMLMHAAVIAVDGVAYAFMAKSGVGKSTHIGLWQKAFGERAVVMNGDKPFFSFAPDGRLLAHGSPWRGKEGLGINTSAPIGGICLLERGAANTIAPATPAEAVGRIFHQILIPSDPTDQATAMAFMDRVLRTVPIYRLACNMDIEAAHVAYAGMSSTRNP